MARKPFVEMVNDETGGTQKCPDRPNVIQLWVERGWRLVEVAEAAPDAPAAPAPPADKADETGAVEAGAVTTGLVPAGSMAVVLDWVGDDPTRAAMALAVENDAEAPRTSLIPKLEALAAGTPEEEKHNG